MKFLKNLKFFNLYSKTQEERNKWQDVLARYCIQSDFHTKFTVSKIIGKGSFAKVYLVENKAKNQQFAVKAFSKEYLLSQSNGRVISLSRNILMRFLLAFGDRLPF
jgi:serine/threonine-protein kinase ULK2